MFHKKILVTGASGFVGTNYLETSKFKNTLEPIAVRPENVDVVNLTNIESIVHLAGKAHEMSKIDDEVYFIANRDLAYNLAKRAKLNGVKQFIYVSSVKVYGKNASEQKLDENTPCQPNDAESKRR